MMRGGMDGHSPADSRSPGLAELLDRVLDQGLVVQADIVISVAGIPLIGINLRAALAGMETMTRYGMMADWDRRIRAAHARPCDAAIVEAAHG